MSHEPFPIADYTEGILLPREPWLSPSNAFVEVNNGLVYRGRLTERYGFKPFAELCVDTADIGPEPEIGGIPILDPGFIKRFSYMATITTDVCVAESVWARSDNGVAGPPYIEVEVDWNTGFRYYVQDGSAFQDSWTYDVVNTGGSTVCGILIVSNDITLGRYFELRVHWSEHPDYAFDPTTVPPEVTNGYGGEMFYRTRSAEDVVGLTAYKPTNGDFSLAADPTSLYVYDAAVGYYALQGGVAAFTGDERDYFWFWPFDDYLLLTNGVDPVTRWTPTAAAGSSLSVQPTTGLSFTINTALIVLRFQGRAVYLNTTEAATVYPRRARFSAPSAYDVFDSDLDFLDAPAELGDIVTAEFIGERLFVGFSEEWAELEYTGDSNQPFRWRPFISRFGAVSKLSTIKDNARLLSRSKTTMQALDPNGQMYFDQEVPDYVKNFSAKDVELCSGFRNENQRSFWWTYTGPNDTRPNNVLNATYDEQGNVAWSRHDMRFNVFSTFDSQQTPSWDDLGPLTWNDYNAVTWNDARIGIEGFTEAIAGGEFGTVYKMGVSNVDEYAVAADGFVNFNFKTQRLTPYPTQKAHFGWLDIYANAGGMLTMEFFADTASSPHKTVMVDLTSEGEGAKVIRRIPIGRTATFHTIKGSSTAGNAVIIDALVPWFRPAGRMRGFN